MTLKQCGVLFSDIDLQSFVYHYVHGHPEKAIVCSNDDPGVTLTYFTARSNLVT